MAAVGVYLPGAGVSDDRADYVGVDIGAAGGDG